MRQPPATPSPSTSPGWRSCGWTARICEDAPQRFWRDLHVGSRRFNPYLALERHAGALATAEQAQETR
jgi:hypothetical protein